MLSLTDRWAAWLSHDAGGDYTVLLKFLETEGKAELAARTLLVMGAPGRGRVCPSLERLLAPGGCWIVTVLALPLVVHSRNSTSDCLSMLREAMVRGPLVAVLHSFTGTAAEAAEAVELGCMIGFAGMVTFRSAAALREVAIAVPADHLLIETDSPFLSPEPLRGRRNEPAHLVHTARCLAIARGESLEKCAATTTANARRLFLRR